MKDDCQVPSFLESCCKRALKSAGLVVIDFAVLMTMKLKSDVEWSIEWLVPLLAVAAWIFRIIFRV